MNANFLDWLQAFIRNITEYYDFTVQPVNKGHLKERQSMVFIDKWFLLGCYYFYFIKEGP